MASLTPRELLTHGALFGLCCVTTYKAGGPYFAATLMAILACHEAGHFVVGRHHDAPVSLPYFIPLPWQVSLGTLGAVIRMDEPVRDRAKLFDIGIAGPLAGLAIAIPLLVIGLLRSKLIASVPGSNLEGNSILYVLLKLAVFGRWLPSGGVDVQLHPMAFAGWVGLLITMINLMPIGQLDGGHVARAALGDRHEVWSRRLHLALPVVGLVVASVMFVIARAAGKDVGGALAYAKYGAIPWFTWSLLLWYMRYQAGEYHPEVSSTPLGRGRQRAAIFMLVVFCLIATPVPFRPVL